MNCLVIDTAFRYRNWMVDYVECVRCAQPMPADLIGTLYADSQMVEIYNRLRNTLLKCSVCSPPIVFARIFSH